MNEHIQDLECGTTNFYQGSYAPVAITNNSTMPMLVIYDYTSAWVFEAAKKLEALGRLRPGWDSYGGEALRPEAKEAVVQVLGWLETQQLPVPGVVLGSGGTVHLEWASNRRELEIELGGPNKLDFVKVHPGGYIEEGAEDFNAREALDRLTRWLRQG